MSKPSTPNNRYSNMSRDGMRLNLWITSTKFAFIFLFRSRFILAIANQTKAAINNDPTNPLQMQQAIIGKSSPILSIHFFALHITFLYFPAPSTIPSKQPTLSSFFPVKKTVDTFATLPQSSKHTTAKTSSYNVVTLSIDNDHLPLSG